MKGIILNMFELYITSLYGEEAYEDLLESCHLQTAEPFVGPGIYPDSDLFELVGQATRQFNIETADMLRSFGSFMLPRLIEKVPSSLANISGPIEFLEKIDCVIHAEVRKLMPDASVPGIDCQITADDKLTMQYSSKRALCWLMEGMIEGVGNHYQTPLEFQQVQCMHQGDAHCTFEVALARAEVNG